MTLVKNDKGKLSKIWGPDRTGKYEAAGREKGQGGGCDRPWSSQQDFLDKRNGGVDAHQEGETG